MKIPQKVRPPCNEESRAVAKFEISDPKISTMTFKLSIYVELWYYSISLRALMKNFGGSNGCD